MQRELNEVETRVLHTAKLLEQERLCGTWGAATIQHKGWPAAGSNYSAGKLGISAALLELRRRGLVVKYGRHSYRLATPGA